MTYERHAVGLLQCSAYTPFWLVMQHGVKLGAGLPLGDVILSHVSVHMESVMLLSVTRNYNAPAKWQFPLDRSES